MKILRARAASVSRQGLCTALLVASLTTAAVGASPPRPTADAGDPAPGPGNPQRLPHGSPNLALPDLVPPPGTPGAPGPIAGSDGAADKATGIPATALAAYKNAEKLAREQWPQCNVPWELIAGIGKVESDHAAMGGGLRTDGSTEKPIIGPPLTGEKFALVRDTDGGRWDHDQEFDHAVGPMQFIPSTWQSYAADGRGTGQKDPNNIFDAAAGTARYLCAGGLDLSRPVDVEKAVLRYNASRDYLNTVLAWMRTYKNGGGGALPDLPVGSRPPAGGTPPAPTVPTPPGTTPPSRPAPPATPGSPKPTPKPNPKPDPKPSDQNKPGDKDKPGDHDKPTPPASASRLERVGDRELTATAGEAFAGRPRVRAVTADGKPVPGTRVEFEVIEEDGPRFPGDARTVTATTGKDGYATAPKLTAGEETGKFTVRATIEDRGRTAVDFTATVKAPPVQHADALVRVGNSTLKAAPGASFGAPVLAKATVKGKALAGVEVTATVLTEDGGAAKAGPYFKGEDGKKLRTLVLPKTGKDGTVTLPELFADDRQGTFTLHLTTEEGVELSLKLTVAGKPDKPEKPTESGKPNKPGKPGDKGTDGKKDKPAGTTPSAKASRTAR